MKNTELKELLEDSYHRYSASDFIDHDPIQIPHSFRLKQDIEISGFFAAVLAWGQRITIINKCRELMNLMDNSPYDFIKNHKEDDLKVLLNFKHRTFNSTDLLYFVSFLNHWYNKNDSLESAFVHSEKDENVEKALIQFRERFFSLRDFPHRTRKHIASPAQNSACKRINMYLRWMVRKDEYKIDFGIWNEIKTSQLICPFDLHVSRVSRALKLVKRKQDDWKTAVELTNRLKRFDPIDPVKYDLALFGMGLDAKVN